MSAPLPGMQVSLIDRKLTSGRRFRVSWNDPNDVLCAVVAVLALIYLVLICVGPFLAPDCDLQPPAGKKWKNPLYDGSPCLDKSLPILGGLTLRQAAMARWIAVSLFLGSLIGYERRSPDRPAGIRSMSLTALGSCCFCLSTNFAFQKGPMDWDSSRIAADIVKGIGFFAGALIWKGKLYSEELGREIQQTQGLTSGTTNWLSAAIGVTCGGGHLLSAVVFTSCIILMLRFGPRNSSIVLETAPHEDSARSRTSRSQDAASKAQRIS